MRAAKVQASLRIRAVSPEPSLLAHISSESRGTFRQKARSLAPLNGWACAVKICHDGMLKDTNSLDGAQLISQRYRSVHYKNSEVALFHCLGPAFVALLHADGSGRVSDSGARGPGFETYRRRVVSLSKTLYSPKVLVNYPGSDGSVPIWLKNCWLGR